MKMINSPAKGAAFATLLFIIMTMLTAGYSTGTGPVPTGAATTIFSSNLTASRALISNSSGKIAVSSTVSDIELGYVDGVTSAIQTQFTNKANASHNHAASDINSGTVATARLGSGTANSTTYLRGDQTWATPEEQISFVRYTGVAAQGSINNYVLRYSTHQQTVGSDLTYSSSSTLGDSFTVNTSGIYSVTVGGTSSPGNMDLFINIGSAINNLTTLTNTTTRAQGVVFAGYSQQACSWTGYVAAGDKIWISSNVAPYNAAGYELTNNVNIARVG